jgi:hypothetical protein
VYPQYKVGIGWRSVAVEFALISVNILTLAKSVSADFIELKSMFFSRAAAI